MKKFLVIMLSMVLVVIFTACGGGSGEIDKEDIAESIEKVELSEEVTAEEKEEVEKLQEEYTEKIAKAKDAKEAAKLKEEFEEKANAATDNKVTVPSVTPSKPSGASDSTKPDNKPASGNSSDENKPSTGNSKPNSDTDSNQTTKPNSGSSDSTKPSQGNTSSGSSGSTKPNTGSTPSTPSKPSHTHITEGDMGWADSPEEIRGIYEARRADWKARVAAGDHTSPEPINYNYQKCGCGKYTGSIVYGNPHTCIGVGNTGMWFDTRDECEAYYDAKLKAYDDEMIPKLENGEITLQEYGAGAFGWEGKQCSCGRWTVSFKYRNSVTGEYDKY